MPLALALALGGGGCGVGGIFLAGLKVAGLLGFLGDLGGGGGGGFGVLAGGVLSPLRVLVLLVLLLLLLRLLLVSPASSPTLTQPLCYGSMPPPPPPPDPHWLPPTQPVKSYNIKNERPSNIPFNCTCYSNFIVYFTSRSIN